MTMKPLGSATTSVEETIEKAISTAPLFRNSSDLVYGPVSGGISNENWRVKERTGAGDWFVKIPGIGTEMFVDRGAAMDASKKAASVGLGPRVYDDLADQGIEINDFIPDRRPSTNSDFADRDIRKAAIGVYKKLHAMPALELTKTVFDMIDEHVEQVHDLGAPVYKDMQWVMLNVEMAREAIHASGLDLVPGFNDPMPGNFMIGADGSIMLIDYEYASMNDRCYDLGIWFGEMFFTPTQEKELIEDYFGSVPQDILSRITVHKALADVKWALWSMVQLKVSRLDFDFHKYGMWKLMRFHQISGHSEWRTHLRSL